MSLSFGEDDWRNQAACAGMDSDNFFAKNGPTPAAREACAFCPVRTDCLEDALTYEFFDDHGFWGGKTRNEREGIRAQREKRDANYRARHELGLRLIGGAA